MNYSMGFIILILNISTWWSSLDVNYQTVIISGCISFFILGLGFIISEAIRRYNKSTELTQYKQFIEEWVTESYQVLDEYISSLQEFSDDIKNNKDLNIPKWTSSIIHFSQINKIPLERYADIYIFGIKHKDYKEKRIQLMNFIYQLEYLEKIQSLIMDRYNEYIKHSEEIMNEWNNCCMNLLNVYSNINYKDNPEAEHFYRLFKNAIDKSSNCSNLDIWESEYIQPTLDEMKKLNPSPASILFKIAIHTRDLSYVIEKHYNFNKYSNVFAGNAADLKTSRGIIDNFKNYFDNKKIKRYCK